MICPQCQTMNEEYFTFCGNCGTPSPDAATSEMPSLLISPGTLAMESKKLDIPDNLYLASDGEGVAPPSGRGTFGRFGGFPGQDDQYLPSSSASQYPRTPGEQYAPDNRAGQYIPADRTPAGQFRPDVRRLTRVEQLAGGATVIVLISLFLPWFGFDAPGSSISVSGMSAHGYLAVAVLLAMLVAGYLLWRSSWEEFPVSLPVTHELLLMAATGLQFVVVAIAFLDVPVAGLSREFGAYLALLASVAAVGLAVRPGLRSRQTRR